MGVIDFIQIENEQYPLKPDHPVDRWLAEKFSLFNNDGDTLLTEAELDYGLAALPSLAAEVGHCLTTTLQSSYHTPPEASFKDRLTLFLNGTAREPGAIRIAASQFYRLPDGTLRDILWKLQLLELQTQSVGDNNRWEQTVQNKCRESSCEEGTESYHEWCRNLFNPTEQSKRYAKLYAGSTMEQPLPPSLFVIPIVMERDLLSVVERGDPLTEIVVSNETGHRVAMRGLYPYTFTFRPGLFSTVPQYADSVSAGHFSTSYEPGFAFVTEYRAEFDRAMAVLTARHPDIHPNNLKLLLTHHFFHELMAINYIDVWQDAASCFDVGCSMEKGFRQFFPELDSPLATSSWWISTLALQNKRAQGYGPGQSILGLALEAAAHRPTAQRYQHLLTQEELTDEDECLKALLDPKKAIYYRALIYDFLLTRLKKTVFKDPRVAYPSNRYPYPVDPETARQMALIEIVQSLSTYPENYPSVKQFLLSGAISTYWAEFFTVGELLDIEPHFPGIRMAVARQATVSLTATHRPFSPLLGDMIGGNLLPFRFIVPTPTNNPCR